MSLKLKDLTPYSIGTSGSKCYKRIGLLRKKQSASNEPLSIKKRLHSIFLQLINVFGLNIIFTIIFNIITLCQVNINHILNLCQLNFNYIIFIDARIITKLVSLCFIITECERFWSVLQHMHFYPKRSILFILFLVVYNINIFNGFIMSEINYTFHIRININLNLNYSIRKYTILTKCILNWFTVRLCNMIVIFLSFIYFIIKVCYSILINILIVILRLNIHWMVLCALHLRFDYVFVIFCGMIIHSIKYIALKFKYTIHFICYCLCRCTKWNNVIRNELFVSI